VAKRSRMMVLSRRTEPGEEPEPLGTIEQIEKMLAAFNTAEDGSSNTTLGLLRLHGPGFVLDLPTSIDKPMQMMASVNDDETAWPVLSRICRNLGWSMTDGETGQTFI